MFSCTLSTHSILLSGPAEALFKPEFFLSMKNALGPNGLICTQGECMWLHLDLIAGVFQQCKEIFPSVKYAYTTIPTYPSGQIGFIIASNGGTVDPSVSSRSIPEDMPLQYYSEGIHRSAFVLPGIVNVFYILFTINFLYLLFLPRIFVDGPVCFINSFLL